MLHVSGAWGGGGVSDVYISQRIRDTSLCAAWQTPSCWNRHCRILGWRLFYHPQQEAKETEASRVGELAPDPAAGSRKEQR